MAGQEAASVVAVDSVDGEETISADKGTGSNVSACYGYDANGNLSTKLAARIGERHHYLQL